jgi:hypothetical protein
VGQEQKTTLRFDGRILEGVAQLEGDALTFRGDVSLTVRFAEIFKVEANAGWLDLQTGRGLLLFELGPKAEVWAERIRNPRALLDKLGVTADKRIVVLGKLDADLRAELAASGATVAKTARGKDFDLAFVAVADKTDLEKVADARALIKEDGALWLVYPRGRAELTEREVLTAGRTRALTDGKPLKVDDVLTAVRFVIPAHARASRRKP